MGDTTGSTLSGTLTGGGEQRAGRSPSRRQAAELTLGPSSYGDWRVAEWTDACPHERLERRSVAHISIPKRARSRSTRSSVAGIGPGAFRLVGARFSDLDLERWTRQPALASRLTGSVSGQVRGVTALADGALLRHCAKGRVSGDLQVDLEPSRFRAQEITRGAVRVRLVDGTANVTGTIESPTAPSICSRTRDRSTRRGRTSWIAARFTNLDLSGWTGAPSLRSRLTGSVTARARGGQGRGLGGNVVRAEMRLDPSTLANLTLEGGQARGSWSGDHTGNSWPTSVRAADTLSVRSEIAMQDRTPTGRADLVVPFRLW
jgi:hypothetical protein